MRCKSLVLALIAAGGVASAQPGPPPQPQPPPMDTTTTTTTTVTEPALPPQPEPQPMAQPQPQPTVQMEVQEDVRPVGISVALGIGYSTPMALDMPNISTLRLRLASGLTFEPALRISNTSSDQEAGGLEESDKLTQFGLGALMRLPIVTHNKVDLEFLGTAGFANSKSNPEGDYNATTSTSLSLGYGVGIAYWINRHWNFTMSVTNPLVEYRTTKVQAGVPGMTAKSSDTTIGIIFVPDVFMMFHLYN
jgi:Outer membrane protein beta-barrel domain